MVSEESSQSHKVVLVYLAYSYEGFPNQLRDEVPVKVLLVTKHFRVKRSILQENKNFGKYSQVTYKLLL